jgi:putative transposase
LGAITPGRQRIEDAGALVSYARPGAPYDNSQTEAGWSTLKTELLPHGGAFASLEKAHLEVTYYLDTYFNFDRHHSALGHRSPHQFEADLVQHLPQFTGRLRWTTPQTRPSNSRQTDTSGSELWSSKVYGIYTGA